MFLETRGILDTGVIENLAERVKGELKYSTRYHQVITCAASLAHHRLLGSVHEMWLGIVDLTSVPAEHLASLASSVTGIVDIKNVRGCDLVTILDSVKSRVLSIRNQSLGREETQALVRAMESRVEEVKLIEEVTLNIRVLMEYSGQGKCWKLVCGNNSANRYREQLRTWATSRNWRVNCDDSYLFSCEDAAQQVLMSSVCPSVCLSPNLKF